VKTPKPDVSAGDPKPAEHSKGSLGEPQGHSPFPVVGIGASAGGLEAFKLLLAHLPEDTGMAFVLVQHLDPRHESRLVDLLSEATRMPVEEAAHGRAVRPDQVYVIPPNTSLAIAKGILHLTPRGEAHGLHLPVDHLFRSLAEDQQARAIGVVLSGTGADGTLGLSEIKAVGGITFAQEEKSAKQPGMPHSAIDSGCVDFVLAPEQIARRLGEIGTHPYLAKTEAPEHIEAEDDEGIYKRILAAVRKVTRVDFSLYRDTTIKRRILRRMALQPLESLVEYARLLEADRSEVEALYSDLLINVTSFFRDPELFEALKTRVFPEIVTGKSASTPLRIWVPGCSTGQEAYSLAIALLEFLDDRPVRPPIEIFATDLADQTALDKARAGVYLDSIEAEVSPERLRRFFRLEDHHYRIEKSIREMCVFARQNVASDPPFSHLDLISCRNVLIYLATPLQKRVLPTFHFALNSPGFLVLGSAETVGDQTDLFELVERTHKIYAKKATASRPPLYFPNEDFMGTAARQTGAPSPKPSDFEREADRILLSRFAPAGVLVNENLEILQFRGRTSAYLEPPPGEPTTSLLKMAREGLFLELRRVLAEAKERNRPARRDGVRVRDDGAIREIDLEAVPVSPTGGHGGCFLVLFHERVRSDGGSPGSAPAAPDADADAGAATGDRQQDGVDEARLRQELAATKEYLQSLIEQQDASNEELRSANEEILSSNEELQSTNEELATAKEEVQSANEELTTVNEQLQHRNVELNQLNNDLANVLSGINIPVVMIGADLRIRRFTPTAKKVMNLLPSDINRPISDIAPAAFVPDLDRLIETVINTVQPVEREVCDRDGRWFALRLAPYRTADDKIDGALLVLIDIEPQKRAEAVLRDADRRKDEFLATMAHEFRNPIAAMRNAVEVVRLADDPATVERAHGVLDRQVGSLSRIVEELLDVSRIAEQKSDLRLGRVSLAMLVKNAVETCQPYIDACRHTLSVMLPSEPLFLDVDPMRISQVLTNLLTNAAKFTEPGGRIWLTAEHAPDHLLPSHGDSPAPDEVIVRVRDTGDGIHADLLPKIFEMFTQGGREHSPDRRTAGLGIGLALVRRLLDSHGGSVEARSDGPGRGSEFTIRLPLARGLQSPAAEPAAHSAPTIPRSERPRRILVVDDHEDHANSLGVLLELMGHEVRLEADGPSALEAAADFLPDVALVDLGLPGMDGYEVARQLRAQERHRQMVLIAQTGWGGREDRRRSREAGFDQHLLKPVPHDQLREAIASTRSDS